MHVWMDGWMAPWMDECIERQVKVGEREIYSVRERMRRM